MATQHALPITRADNFAGWYQAVIAEAELAEESGVRRVPDESKEQIRSMLPTRSLPTPQDIAAVILFLGSPVNRQITGEVIRVTGGRHSLLVQARPERSFVRANSSSSAPNFRVNCCLAS